MNIPYSNYNLDTHLRDIFDIIGYIQVSNDRKQFLSKFLYFVHRRAYSSLASRVLEFAGHWGRSPFDIIQDHSADIAACSSSAKHFDLTLDLGQYRIFFPYVSGVALGAPGATDAGVSVYTFSVEPNNIVSWISLFQHLWTKLEKELSQPASERQGSSRPVTPGSQHDTSSSQYPRSTPPDVKSTHAICILIGSRFVLRPILKHILLNCGPQLHDALRLAGMFDIIITVYSSLNLITEANMKGSRLRNTRMCAGSREVDDIDEDQCESHFTPFPCPSKIPF